MQTADLEAEDGTIRIPWVIDDRADSSALGGRLFDLLPQMHELSVSPRWRMYLDTLPLAERLRKRAAMQTIETHCHT